MGTFVATGWPGRGGEVERWGSRAVYSNLKHTSGMVRKIMVIRPGLGPDY